MCKKKSKATEVNLRVEPNILQKRIDKVFIIVLAEGYFTEKLHHNSQMGFWGMFKAINKALEVAKAKIPVGYFFSKMKLRKENLERKLIIREFAPIGI